MKYLTCIRLVAAAALSVAASLHAGATTTSFVGDPFAGSTALTTPGRQVFAGLELTLPSFDPHVDKFFFDAPSFGLTGNLSFLNSLSTGISTRGADVIVLQDTDNDNNPATPFNAGTAASVIAQRVDFDAPGFFIYHNSVLNVNRLVFSTDLADPTADLSVLARIASPTGVDAINALPTFTSGNFVSGVPEPSSAALLGVGLVVAGFLARRRQR